MKKVPIFILFCLISYSSFCDTITLNQALQSKMINLSITGADKPDDNTYKSSYTGDCIEMSIENISGKTIKVFLDAGRFLQPEDTSLQRMMVTKEQMITLEKSNNKKVKVYAMCTQMLHGAPSPTTAFLIGSKAKGKLLELAQVISKNNFQDNAAQSAIWALTDNSDLYDIYCDNVDEMLSLKNFVKKAKGITESSDQNKNKAFDLDKEAAGTFVKYGNGKITGSFEFELKADTPLSLILYNDKGEVTHKCVENLTFYAGQNTLTYELTYKYIPIGNYHLKMTDNKGKLLLDKILTFK